MTFTFLMVNSRIEVYFLILLVWPFDPTFADSSIFFGAQIP